jgi:hypothetical protein
LIVLLIGGLSLASRRMPSPRRFGIGRMPTI